MTIERARELIAEYGIEHEEHWAGGKLYTTLTHPASPDKYDCLTDEEIIDAVCNLTLSMYRNLPPFDIIQYLCKKA